MCSVYWELWGVVTRADNETSRNFHHARRRPLEDRRRHCAKRVPKHGNLDAKMIITTGQFALVPAY